MVIKTQSGAEVEFISEFISEFVTSMYHSRVLVYEDGRLVAQVIAEIVRERGDDDRFYTYVVFKRTI